MTTADATSNSGTRSGADRTLWYVVLAICAFGTGTDWLLGGFHAEITLDTETYFHLGNFAHSLGATRTPLYGWLTGPLYFSEWRNLIAPLQVGAYVVGVLALVGALNLYGLSKAGIVAVTFALMTSTPLFYGGNWIMPDLLALAFGFLAIAAVLSQRETTRLAWLIVLFAAGGACYILRPIYLPLIVALPVLHWILSDKNRSKRRTAIVFVAAIMPFFLYSGIRYVYTSDFNTVSYGGYQASGLTSLMATPDLVSNLPARDRSTAADMLSLRVNAQNRAQIVGLPPAYGGIRRFRSVAVFFPDALAYGYDEVLLLNRTLQAKNESWVAFNARLMRADLAIIRAAPVSYLEWIAGSSARFVGQAFVLNPSFLVGMCLMIVGLFIPGRFPECAARDLRTICALGISWLFAGGALSVLASYPHERYIGAASVFLSAVPTYFLVMRLAPLRMKKI